MERLFEWSGTKANYCMSKKHYSKHCHIAVEAYDNGVPLYRVNVGNMEYGRFSFGLPLAYPLCSEECAIQWMTDIDEYIEAYIESERQHETKN